MMLKLHIDGIKLNSGRARADFSIKMWYGDNDTASQEQKFDASEEDLTEAINLFIAARHLVKEAKDHHTQKCNECVADAIGAKKA